MRFADPDQAAKATRDLVAPAQRSEAALDKLASRRIDDGTSAHRISGQRYNAKMSCPELGTASLAGTYHVAILCPSLIARSQARDCFTVTSSGE